MEYQTLYERVKAIHSGIPTDDMGGSPLDKCYMMAYLARRFKMKTFVEIGVYRGKSLFSVAPAFLDNAGRCYGIDPWLSQNLREKELPDEVKVAVDSFADAADFDALYHEVLEKRQQLNMNDSVTILRKTAEQACAYFLEHMLSERVKVVDEGGGNDQTDVFIDMLHIDGNHDYEFVSKDARLYIPHVRQGGIVVFDDVGWSGVRRVYDQAKEQMIVLYEDCDFAVLYRDDVLAQEMRESSHPMPSWAKIRLLRMSLPALMENVRFSQNYDCEPRRLRILAAVMSYNSSDYIEECLQSIAAQQGDFDIEIAVFDDASTDDTIKRVRKLSELPGNVNITVYTKKINEGYEKNYIRVFNALRESNADFLTCIDGDDYLLSPLRIMRNINELLRRPECALSFNRLLLYYQAQSLFDLWRDQDKLSENTYTALDLAGEYFIGNGSCSTVRRNAAVGVPEDLFLKVKAGDWLAHCMYATKGDIAYIREPMNVYRKHSQGAWTGIPPRKQGDLLHKSVAEFNKLTEYLFYARLYRKQAERFQGKEMEDCTTYDLTIIDDVFPHPSSGFRAAEYGAYLSRFDNMRILCNGSSVAVLGKRLHTDIMAAYKQANPELADKLLETIHTYELPLERTLKSKLAYFCFLGNAFTSLEVVERNKIPFVFELYPGGSFQLDAISSDIMLERVLHSPCFRKVIVTQDVTKDYLLRHNLCSEDRIVSIFGVVTPRQMLETVPQPPPGR